MIKKLSIFLVLLLAVVLLAVPVLSAQSATMTVAVDKTIVDREGVVVVTVSVSKVDNCTNGGFVFTYDKNIFEYVSGEALSGTNGYFAQVSTAGGNVAGLFMNNNKTVEGELFLVTLKVKADAPYGNYEITGVPNMTAGEAVTCTVNKVTVKVACAHIFEQYEKVDDNNHQTQCTKCQLIEKEPHDWNDGQVITKPSCEQPGEALLTCLLCHATTTEPIIAHGHQWDNACDTDCNICGQAREISHSYSETISKDDTGHWYGCTVCGDKKDFAAHDLVADSANANAKICSACNYIVSQSHVHQMSTEWITNEDEHWHRCQVTSPSCSYVEDRAIHEYDNACDVGCNTCGYIRLAPPHNFNDQWQGNADTASQ